MAIFTCKASRNTFHVPRRKRSQPHEILKSLNFFGTPSSKSIFIPYQRQIMHQNTDRMIPITPTIRKAVTKDIPALTQLMEASVRRLNIRDYTPQQVESALEYAFVIDRQLIDGGTYYVAEVGGEIAGCGGWSRNSTLAGENQSPCDNGYRQVGSPGDAAKIRAVFVHPHYERQGIGRRLMQISEMAARQAGVTRLELLATLTGEPLYRQCGFTPLEWVTVTLPDGISLQGVQMEKRLVAVNGEGRK